MDRYPLLCDSATAPVAGRRARVADAGPTECEQAHKTLTDIEYATAGWVDWYSLRAASNP
jgi:hypothetical protein